MINWMEEVLLRKNELLEDLTSLLKIESVKDETTKSEKHPMGEKIGEALEFMLALGEKNNFDTKNVDGFAGHIQYGNFSVEDTIGILCHVDVVPATGDWSSPPFVPNIRDGKLFARGAIDDKGPTIAAFYGLKIVKELGLPINKNVRMIVGTDEESGMSCLKYYKEVENIPTLGFAPDAVFPIINAEKGQINVILEMEEQQVWSQEGDIILHSFKSGNRFNMVPEKAVASLSGNVEELLGQLKHFCDENHLRHTVSFEGRNVEITLYGVSAHGMEPHNGRNAATLLAQFLQKYEFNEKAKSYISFLVALHDDFEGTKLNVHYTDAITGPLTVNPGIFSYEESGEKTVILNIRVPVTTDYEDIQRRLKNKVKEYGFTIKNLMQSNPHHVDASDPMIRILQDVYVQETGLEPTLLSTGGATYARFMEKGVAFGACFPGKEMTAHQQNEFIEIEDLLKATAIYARAIYELVK